jgi:hypothetical protein
VKARVVYDSDGTENLAVEAPRLSTQLWDSGRALIKAYDGDRLIRAVHITRAYLIDVDREML